MNLGEWTDMHTLRDSAGSDVFKPWNEAVAGNAGNDGELCTIAIEDPPGVRLRYPSQDQRRLEFHILAEGSRGNEKVLITAVQLLRYNGNDNIQQFTLGTVRTWAAGDDQDEPELPDDFKPF